MSRNDRYDKMTGKIEELNKAKPCSRALAHPAWEELTNLLALYGADGMGKVGLMDTSHDEKDVRWNYIIDRKYVLRLTNAPEMREERLADLNRLIARYGAFGLRCPAFIRGKDGRFFHSWGELTVYLSEYVDLPVAGEMNLTAAEQDALREEVVLSLGRFMARYRDVDLIPTMGMYSLFDLSPYDAALGLDEKQQNMDTVYAALRKWDAESLAKKLAAKNGEVRARLLQIYRELPRCVTQGDENFTNVLLDDAGHMAGLIDFNLAGTDVCVNLIANNADFNLDVMEDRPLDDPAAVLEDALASYRKNAAMLLTVYPASQAERLALADYAWIALASQWPYACAFTDRLQQEQCRPSTLALLEMIAELDMDRLAV